MLHGIQSLSTLLCPFLRMGSTSLKGMSGLGGMGGESHSWDFTAPSCPATGVSVGGIPLEWSPSFWNRSEDLDDSSLSSGLSCLFPVAAMEASEVFLSVLLQLKNNPCLRKPTAQMLMCLISPPREFASPKPIVAPACRSFLPC